MQDDFIKSSNFLGSTATNSSLLLPPACQHNRGSVAASCWVKACRLNEHNVNVKFLGLDVFYLEAHIELYLDVNNQTYSIMQAYKYNRYSNKHIKYHKIDE